jgi:hypothetical protein
MQILLKALSKGFEASADTSPAASLPRRTFRQQKKSRFQTLPS